MLSLAGAKLHLIFLICKILGSFFNSRASYFAVFGGRGLLTGAPLIIFTLCCSTSRTRAHHSTLPRGNGGMAIPLLYIRPSEGFSNKELSGVDNLLFMIFNRLSPLLSARRISTAIAYGFHSPPTRLQKVSFYCVKDSRSHNKRPCIRS